jgi:hypothetical protein
VTAPAELDPFGGDTAPAVSWKDAPVGTVVTLEVTDTPKQVQGKDFKTKKPATWPDGNPKYSVVINGRVNGEDRGLWMNKPSAMFGAIKDAQKKLGRPIRPGDTLAVRFSGTRPTDGDPQKLYEAKITPGTPPAPPAADPFGGSADDQPPW